MAKRSLLPSAISLWSSWLLSKSQSHSTQTADQAASSSIAAGGDVNIVAKGAGNTNDKSDKSDILIQGSKVSAGGAVVVQADDQLTLQAAANTAEQKSSNSSRNKVC